MLRKMQKNLKPVWKRKWKRLLTIRKLKKHRVRIKRMQIKRCKKTKKKMLWNQKRMKCQTILKRERKQREKNRLRLIEILNQSKIQMKCGNCTLELKRKEIRKKLKLKR